MGITVDDEGRKHWDDFSARDVPDEYQNQLQEAGSLADRGNFLIGKKSHELLQALEAEEVEVGRMQFYKACGAWAGCSGEHVRRCIYVASHVPKWVVDKFDMINFSQWYALVPHCTTGEDYERKVEEWLEYSASTGTQLTSVDGMRGWLSDDESGRPASYVKHYRMIVQRADILRSDNEVPQEIRSLCNRFLRALREAGKLGHLADWDPDKYL